MTARLPFHPLSTVGLYITTSDGRLAYVHCRGWQARRCRSFVLASVTSHGPGFDAVAEYRAFGVSIALDTLNDASVLELASDASPVARPFLDRIIAALPLAEPLHLGGPEVAA